MLKFRVIFTKIRLKLYLVLEEQLPSFLLTDLADHQLQRAPVVQHRHKETGHSGLQILGCIF